MNLALEATHRSEEGLPRGKVQNFSTSLVSGENVRKIMIEDKAIYLPVISHISILATEQKIKYPALPKVTRK